MKYVFSFITGSLIGLGATVIFHNTTGPALLLALPVALLNGYLIGKGWDA